jgi:hypothetical protein
VGMTNKEKIEKAKKSGIDVPKKLIEEKNIVGIYEFFRIKKGEKDHCFYIGKSTDMAYRLLGSSSGHIYMYLQDNYSKLVPSKIKEYIEDGYRIEVKIIEINYHDKSFTNAAHRLALEELKEIVKYQSQGQCKFQTPEGVGMYEKKFWEENYKDKE